MEFYFNAATAPDGSIFVLATVNDYGDFKMPDYEDPEFDWEHFDYDAMEKARTTSYKLFTFDSSGASLSANEIKIPEKYFDPDDDEAFFYINNIYPINSEKAVVMVDNGEQTYVELNSDGSFGKEADLGEDVWFNSACASPDGNIVFMTYEGTGQVLKTLDTNTLTFTDEVIKLDDIQMNGTLNMLSGRDDYIYFISTSSGLFGIKADGSSNELINWVDSDLNGDYITSVIDAGDGDFIIYENNWETNSQGFFRLTKRDASELADTVIINLAVNYADQYIIGKVTEFNKSSDKYRIKVNDYNKFYEYDEEKEQMNNTPEKQLKMDIVSGNTPDIIYFSAPALYANLSKKGAFADLYQFMDDNSPIKKDDIIPNILEACEFDGKLTMLPTSFNVNTYLAKTKFIDKENWTFDDLIETYNNLPEGMKLFKDVDNTKESVFNILGYGSFIDWENSTCTFDSPEFVKLLEFADQFDNEGEGESINWDTATDEEMEKYWQDEEVALLNDKALLGQLSFYDAREYSRQRYGYFGDEVTFVGYPSNDGSGADMSFNMSFAIMNDSSVKEACWDFISSTFDDSDEESDSKYYYSGLPIQKTQLEKIFDEAMEDPYWLDENGKKQPMDNTMYILDKEIEIPNLTQEERDMLIDYICSAKPSGLYYDMDVQNIIDEETKAFFAGERSAQETADMIQNRVSILISEQS